MRKIPTAVAFLVCSCTAIVSRAQTRVDVVQIYERFVASRVVAEHCRALDAATEQRFLSNLMAVTIRAAQLMKERNSALSDDQLGSKTKERADWLRRNIVAEIEQNGCSSPPIRQLLELYKVHSEMHLDGGR